MLICALLAVPVSAAFQNGERSTDRGLGALIDRLEEQGVDVTAIRAAVEQGDYETARTLMKQVLESRNDALPEKSQNGCSEGKGPFGCRGVRTAE